MQQELLNTELSTLERKLSLLIKEHQTLKDTIQSLNEENSKLRTVMAGKQELLDSFSNKSKISKLVNTIGADQSDSAELKERLDEHIKEIDRCISHLSV